MSEQPPEPQRYRVSYSERVRQSLKELLRQARAQGFGHELLEAVKEFDERLHIYPQFGEPLIDLELESAQLWVGAVPPLVLRYIIDEERRQVSIVNLPLLLPEIENE